MGNEKNSSNKAVTKSLADQYIMILYKSSLS